MITCSISALADRHVKSVSRYFNDGEFIAINSDTFSDSDLQFDSNAILSIQNIEITSSLVKSIWFRKPSHQLAEPLLHANYSEQEFLSREYKYREIQDFLKGVFLWAEWNGVFVVSSSTAKHRANNKLFQLQLAQRMDVCVPKTLVSTDAKLIREFCEKNRTAGIIKKALRAKVVSTDKTMIQTMTEKVVIDDLLSYISNKSSIDYPIFLQQRINKKLELRVTVVGNQVFTCSILTQDEDTAGKENWLLSALPVQTSIYTLPNKIRNFCLEYTRVLGLQYATYDFAVDESGEFIFFECNPNGEYLWLEDATGIPISQGMANLLQSPANYSL